MGINKYRDLVSKFDCDAFQALVDKDPHVHRHLKWSEFERECTTYFAAWNAIPKVRLEFPPLMHIQAEPTKYP